MIDFAHSDDEDYGAMHLSNSNDSFANQSQSEGDEVEEMIDSDDEMSPPPPTTEAFDGLRQRHVFKTEDSLETGEEEEEEETPVL